MDNGWSGDGFKERGIFLSPQDLPPPVQSLERAGYGVYGYGMLVVSDYRYSQFKGTSTGTMISERV